MSIEDVDDLESSLAHVDFDHENIDDEECTEKSELVRSIAHYTKVKSALAALLSQEGAQYFTAEISSRWHCGLRNISSTCYMNSLLQGMFMTPEFRKGLFMWTYSADGGVSEELSTPRQLQRLFAEMQMGKRRTQSTTDLCTSFGWDNADMFVQQDVLELCDVMLDAINQETRSKTKAPITGIFAGKIKNCLKSECGKYSRQNVEDCKELMLDLGDNKTIEAAISQFISASELTGDNKWKPAAGITVNAKRWTALHQLPPILMIHLKRFTFNYVSMQRVKVDSNFTFQRYLDMSPFVSAATTGDPTLNYELYGILIHVGTARGGHYFAHIKDLYQARGDKSPDGDNSWYVFDDATVSPLPAHEVAAMFRTEDDTIQAAPLQPDNHSKSLDLEVEHSDTLKMPSSKLWMEIRELNMARLFPSRFKSSLVEKVGGKAAHEVGSIRRVTFADARTPSLAFIEVVAIEPKRSVAFVQRKTRIVEDENVRDRVTTLELLADPGGNAQHTTVRMHIKLRDHVSTQEAEKLRQDLRRDVTELREVLEKNVFFGLSKPRQVGRTRGGALVQRNAYMLLYRGTSLGPPTLPALPTDLQADIDAKNKVFDMMKSAFNVHVHMVDVCVRVAQTSGLPLESGFNDNTVTITTHDTTALAQVQQRACTQLITDEDQRRILQQKGRVRLRQRDPRTDFPTATFPADAASRSLQELSISGQACMLLEVLSDGDEFEVYNPNEIIVCVHGWNATTNALTKEKHVVSVDGEHGATLRQLHAAVEKAKPALWAMHGGGGAAPCFRLVSLHGHEAIDLSDEDSFDRTHTLLKDVHLKSGAAIVVEWGDRENSSIVAAYNAQQNSVTINFNHPDDADPKTRKNAATEAGIKGAEDPNDWIDRHSVSCDSRDTLLKLKQQIAQHLGLDQDLIHLRRGRSAGMIKDEAKTLRSMGFVDGTLIFVAPGPVIPKGHHVFRFEQYMSETADQATNAPASGLPGGGSSDTTTSKDNRGNSSSAAPNTLVASKLATKALVKQKKRSHFKHLFEMPLSELKTIRQIRRMLGDRLDHPWDQIRIREVKNGYIGTFYRDGQSLRACRLRNTKDSITLAVELLDHSEKLTKYHKMVLCRRVRPGYPRKPPKKTVIEPPTHIIVSKTFTIGQLKQRLLEAAGLSGTDTDWSSEIQLAKWPKWKNAIKTSQLKTLAWADPGVLDDLPITHKPFGYRDGTVLWRTRTEQEKAVAEITKARADGRLKSKPSADRKRRTRFGAGLKGKGATTHQVFTGKRVQERSIKMLDVEQKKLLQAKANSGQSVPDSEVVELYRAKVKQLQDMGFDKTEEELAQLLHRCRGDTQSACLSLMGCS